MATVTQLQFNISSNYDGGAVDRARQSIAALNRDLDNLSNKSVKVTVQVDNSALTQLRTELDQFSRMHATATASINVNMGGLEAARAQLERFGATRYVAQADVNTDRAHAGLTSLTHDADDSSSHLRLLGGAAGGASSGIAGIGGASGGASSGIGSVGAASSSGAASMGTFGTAIGYAGLALIAIGPIAALASAAVIGALGTAFIGVGAMALAQTAVVKNAFTGLKNSVMADALQAAQGMKAPLLAGIAQLEVGLHGLVPVFAQAFTAAGSLIKPMISSFLEFSHNVMPGVVTALRAAGPVFDGLKTGMAALGTGMSKMFSGMAAGAKGAGAALSTALGGIGKILGIVGVAFGQMAAAGAKSLAGLMNGLVSLTKGAMAGFVAGVKIMNTSLGPFLAELGKFAGQILQGLLPALAALMHALMLGLTPVLKALGPVFIIVGAAVTRLGLAFAPLMAVIGTLVARVLTALMPAFNALVTVWSKAASTILTALIPVFIKLIPSVVLLATAFAKIVIAMTPLIPVMALFDLAAIKLLTLLLPVVTVLLQIAAALMGAFATAIKFTIGLFTNWGTTWHTVTAAFVTAWNAVAAALTVAWNATWNAMSIAAKAIWAGLTVAWNAFITGLRTVFTALSSALTVAWSAMWTGMSTAAKAIWTGMQVAWQAFSNAMQTVMTALRNAMVAAWNLLWNTFKTVAEAAWAVLRTAWNAFSSAMQVAMTALRNAMVAAWNLLWNTFKSVATAAWNALKTGFNAFRSAIEAAMTALRNAMVAAWNLLWNTFKTVANAAWNALKTGFNAFRTAFMAATNALMKAMTAAWSAGAKAIGAAWNAIKKLIRDPIQAVVNVVYNNGIVKLWNVVAGVFGAPKLSNFTLPAFATGGPVSGPGSGTSDGVVARLSSGEHVWTAAEVQAAGGHDAVMGMRESVMGSASYKAAAHGDGLGGFALGGIIPSPGDILGDIGGFFSKAFKIVGGVASAAFNVATGFGGDIISHLKDLALGAVSGIVNPLIQKAANVGKDVVRGIIPGSPFIETLIAGGPGGVVSTGGSNPQDAPQSAQGGLTQNNGNGIIQKMADYIKSWITAHDIPVGGGNTAEAQAWADKQVGKPYSLGAFGSSFDCSSFMSGIAQIILGKAPSPLFTTFAFTGAKQGPATFEKDLSAPFMVGVENRGIGHMAGTLNGKNYEATPPAVRSGPGARGAKDAMFDMVYGMKASVGGGQGVIPTGQHLAVIDAALAAAGVPPPGTKAQWEAGMNTLITRESAWNSSAVNNTDSNAAAGHPSQGLAQVIPSTFAAYHAPGTSNNIQDPIANVAAAIRYIVARYGNITNVQQANASLPPKGYWTGTNSARSGWHMVGERGPEWTWFGGGEKVLPTGQTPGGSGSPVVVTVTNHWHGNPTKEAVQHAETGMADKLRRACHAGVGGRSH